MPPRGLLIGDKDYPPLIACDETIVAGIGGCRKIDVPGGDHLLPLRVPELVADTIIELAADSPPSRSLPTGEQAQRSAEYRADRANPEPAGPTPSRPPAGAS